MLTRELWMCEAALAIFLIVYLPQRELTAWFSRTTSKPADVPIAEMILTAPVPQLELALAEFETEPLYSEPERVPDALPIPEPVLAAPLPPRDEADVRPGPRRRPRFTVVIRFRCSWIRVRPIPRELTA